MPSVILGLPEDDLQHVLAHTRAHWEDMRGKRVLLTGGTGFIGKWLLATFLYANRTLALNAKVLVLSRSVAAFQNQFPELLAAEEIEWLEGDVRYFTLAHGQACDFAIHAATDVVAACSPSEVFDTCVNGTRQVLDQLGAAGGKRMLLLSSGAVYGRTPPEVECIPEEWSGAPDPLTPGAAYGEGKRASELLCAIAASEHGLVIPVARCFAFVGPYLPLDKHFAIGNFINAALTGQPIHIQGDGTPLRSYLYASDLAIWLWTLLFRGTNARAYNVGGAESVSIAALAERVVGALQSPSPVVVAQQAKPGAPTHKYVPDVRRASDELGLRAYLSLDEAIERTAQWAKLLTL